MSTPEIDVERERHSDRIRTRWRRELQQIGELAVAFYGAPEGSPDRAALGYRLGEARRRLQHLETVLAALDDRPVGVS